MVRFLVLVDHVLDSQVHSNGFVNIDQAFDRNLTSIDHVSLIFTVGQDGYPHTSRWLELQQCDGYMLLS